MLFVRHREYTVFAAGITTELSIRTRLSHAQIMFALCVRFGHACGYRFCMSNVAGTTRKEEADHMGCLKTFFCKNVLAVLLGFKGLP